MFIAYSPGIPMLAGYYIANNALLVYQKTKFIAYIAVGGVILNIPLNLLFIKTFGLQGVAISTACLEALVFSGTIVAVHLASRKTDQKS